MGGTPDEVPETYKIASPVTHASNDDPPVLTLHGDQDVLIPLSQAKKLDEKLNRAGAAHTLMVMPGQGHDFVGEDQQKAIRAMWAFFDRNLKSR